MSPPETTMNRTLPLSTLVATAMVAACTSMGSGSGTLAQDRNGVAFAWDSKDGGITGKMSATLIDGASFSGPFVQITSTPRDDPRARALVAGLGRGLEVLELPGLLGRVSGEPVLDVLLLGQRHRQPQRPIVAATSLPLPSQPAGRRHARRRRGRVSTERRPHHFRHLRASLVGLPRRFGGASFHVAELAWPSAVHIAANGCPNTLRVKAHAQCSPPIAFAAKKNAHGTYGQFPRVPLGDGRSRRWWLQFSKRNSSLFGWHGSSVIAANYPSSRRES